MGEWRTGVGGTLVAGTLSNGVPSADAPPVGVAVAVGALRRPAPFGGLAK